MKKLVATSGASKPLWAGLLFAAAGVYLLFAFVLPAFSSTTRGHLFIPGEKAEPWSTSAGFHNSIPVGITYYGPPGVEIKLCVLFSSAFDSTRKCIPSIWIDIEG
jgi:hypothetical protein